jgi:hypothetical protein
MIISPAFTHKASRPGGTPIRKSAQTQTAACSIYLKISVNDLKSSTKANTSQTAKSASIETQKSVY